ncbi:MAG: HEAT repeat domain-containing protein, partial [Candidatus Omnitrophota bacterium]
MDEDGEIKSELIRVLVDELGITGDDVQIMLKKIKFFKAEKGTYIAAGTGEEKEEKWFISSKVVGEELHIYISRKVYNYLDLYGDSFYRDRRSFLLRLAAIAGHERGENELTGRYRNEGIDSALAQEMAHNKAKDLHTAFLTIFEEADDMIQEETTVKTNKELFIRIEALGSIGKQEDKLVIGTLIDIMLDNEEAQHIRSQAALALGGVRDIEVVEALIKLLSDADSCMRSLAAEVLGEFGGMEEIEDKIVDALIEALNSELSKENPSLYVCSAIIRVLVKIRDIKAVEPIRNVLAYYVEDYVKDEENYVDDRDEQFSITIMDQQVCRDVISALVEFKDREAAAVLIRLLSRYEDVPLFRRKVVWALGEIGNVEAVDYLIGVLEDSSFMDVREEVIIALEKLGDKRAVEPFMEMLEGLKEFNDPYSIIIKEGIINALGVLGGDKRAIELLKSFLDDNYLAYYAEYALEKILSHNIPDITVIHNGDTSQLGWFPIEGVTVYEIGMYLTENSPEPDMVYSIKDNYLDITENIGKTCYYSMRIWVDKSQVKVKSEWSDKIMVPTAPQDFIVKLSNNQSDNNKVIFNANWTGIVDSDKHEVSYELQVLLYKDEQWHLLSSISPIKEEALDIVVDSKGVYGFCIRSCADGIYSAWMCSEKSYSLEIEKPELPVPLLEGGLIDIESPSAWLLRWDIDSCKDVTGYRIKEYADDEFKQNLKNYFVEGAGANSYEFENKPPGRYYYRVYSMSGEYRSEASNVQEVVVRPPRPQISAYAGWDTANDERAIYVSWEKADLGSNYDISYKVRLSKIDSLGEESVIADYDDVYDNVAMKTNSINIPVADESAEYKLTVYTLVRYKVSDDLIQEIQSFGSTCKVEVSVSDNKGSSNDSNGSSPDEGGIGCFVSAVLGGRRGATTETIDEEVNRYAGIDSFIPVDSTYTLEVGTFAKGSTNRYPLLLTVVRNDPTNIDDYYKSLPLYYAHLAERHNLRMIGPAEIESGYDQLRKKMGGIFRSAQDNFDYGLLIIDRAVDGLKVKFVQGVNGVKDGCCQLKDWFANLTMDDIYVWYMICDKAVVNFCKNIKDGLKDIFRESSFSVGKDLSSDRYTISVWDSKGNIIGKIKFRKYGDNNKEMCLNIKGYRQLKEAMDTYYSDVDEFDNIMHEIRRKFGFGNSPVYLIGGSDNIEREPVIFMTSNGSQQLPDFVFPRYLYEYESNLVDESVANRREDPNFTVTLEGPAGEKQIICVIRDGQNLNPSTWILPVDYIKRTKQILEHYHREFLNFKEMFVFDEEGNVIGLNNLTLEEVKKVVKIVGWHKDLARAFTILSKDLYELPSFNQKAGYKYIKGYAQGICFYKPYTSFDEVVATINMFHAAYLTFRDKKQEPVEGIELPSLSPTQPVIVMPGLVDEIEPIISLPQPGKSSTPVMPPSFSPGRPFYAPPAGAGIRPMSTSALGNVGLELGEEDHNLPSSSVIRNLQFFALCSGNIPAAIGLYILTKATTVLEKATYPEPVASRQRGWNPKLGVNGERVKAILFLAGLGECADFVRNAIEKHEAEPTEGKGIMALWSLASSLRGDVLDINIIKNMRNSEKKDNSGPARSTQPPQTGGFGSFLKYIVESLGGNSSASAAVRVIPGSRCVDDLFKSVYDSLFGQEIKVKEGKKSLAKLTFRKESTPKTLWESLATAVDKEEFERWVGIHAPDSFERVGLIIFITNLEESKKLYKFIKHESLPGYGAVFKDNLEVLGGFLQEAEKQDITPGELVAILSQSLSSKIWSSEKKFIADILAVKDRVKDIPTAWDEYLHVYFYSMTSEKMEVIVDYVKRYLKGSDRHSEITKAIEYLNRGIKSLPLEEQEAVSRVKLYVDIISDLADEEIDFSDESINNLGQCKIWLLENKPEGYEGYKDKISDILDFLPTYYENEDNSGPASSKPPQTQTGGFGSIFERMIGPVFGFLNNHLGSLVSAEELPLHSPAKEDKQNRLEIIRRNLRVVNKASVSREIENSLPGGAAIFMQINPSEGKQKDASKGLRTGTLATSPVEEQRLPQQEGAVLQANEHREQQTPMPEILVSSLNSPTILPDPVEGLEEKAWPQGKEPEDNSRILIKKALPPVISLRSQRFYLYAGVLARWYDDLYNNINRQINVLLGITEPAKEGARRKVPVTTQTDKPLSQEQNLELFREYTAICNKIGEITVKIMNQREKVGAIEIRLAKRKGKRARIVKCYLEKAEEKLKILEGKKQKLLQRGEEILTKIDKDALSGLVKDMVGFLNLPSSYKKVNEEKLSLFAEVLTIILSYKPDLREEFRSLRDEFSGFWDGRVYCKPSWSVDENDVFFGMRENIPHDVDEFFKVIPLYFENYTKGHLDGRHNRAVWLFANKLKEYSEWLARYLNIASKDEIDSKRRKIINGEEIVSKRREITKPSNVPEEKVEIKQELPQRLIKWVCEWGKNADGQILEKKDGVYKLVYAVLLSEYIAAGEKNRQPTDEEVREKLNDTVYKIILREYIKKGEKDRTPTNEDIKNRIDKIKEGDTKEIIFFFSSVPAVEKFVDILGIIEQRKKEGVLRSVRIRNHEDPKKREPPEQKSKLAFDFSIMSNESKINVIFAVLAKKLSKKNKLIEKIREITLGPNYYESLILAIKDSPEAIKALEEALKESREPKANLQYRKAKVLFGILNDMLGSNPDYCYELGEILEKEEGNRKYRKSLLEILNDLLGPKPAYCYKLGEIFEKEEGIHKAAYIFYRKAIERLSDKSSKLKVAKYYCAMARCAEDEKDKLKKAWDKFELKIGNKAEAVEIMRNKYQRLDNPKTLLDLLPDEIEKMVLGEETSPADTDVSESTDENKVQEYIEEAEAAYYAWDFQQAISSYKAAIEQDPNSLTDSIRYQLGKSYYKTGQYEKAVEQFEYLHKRCDCYHKDLALVYYDCNKYEDAVNILKDLIDNYSELVDSNTYIYLGMSYDKLGNYGESIKQFNQLQEFCRDVGMEIETLKSKKTKWWIEKYAEKSSSHGSNQKKTLSMGKSPSFLETVKALRLQLFAKTELDYIKAAEIYEANCQFKRAGDCYFFAAERVGSGAENFYNRALSLYLESKSLGVDVEQEIDKCKSRIADSKASTPHEPRKEITQKNEMRVLDLVGQASNFFHKAGNIDEALKCYQQAAEIYPFDYIFRGIGYCYLAKGDFAAGKKYYEKALEAAVLEIASYTDEYLTKGIYNTSVGEVNDIISILDTLECIRRYGSKEKKVELKSCMESWLSRCLTIENDLKRGDVDSLMEFIRLSDLSKAVVTVFMSYYFGKIGKDKDCKIYLALAEASMQSVFPSAEALIVIDKLYKLIKAWDTVMNSKKPLSASASREEHTAGGMENNSLGDYKNSFMQYKTTGDEFYGNRDLIKAKKNYELAVSDFEKLKQEGISSDMLFEAGQCYQRLGDIYLRDIPIEDGSYLRGVDSDEKCEKALGSYQKSLELYQNLENSTAVEKCRKKIGKAYCVSAKLAEQDSDTNRLYIEAVKYGYGGRNGYQIYDLIAIYYQRSGEYEESIKYWLKAINAAKIFDGQFPNSNGIYQDISRQNSSVAKDIFYFSSGIGVNYFKLKKYEKAIEQLEKLEESADLDKAQYSDNILFWALSYYRLSCDETNKDEYDKRDKFNKAVGVLKEGLEKGCSLKDFTGDFNEMKLSEDIIRDAEDLVKAFKKHNRYSNWLEEMNGLLTKNTKPAFSEIIQSFKTIQSGRSNLKFESLDEQKGAYKVLALAYKGLGDKVSDENLSIWAERYSGKALYYLHQLELLGVSTEEFVNIANDCRERLKHKMYSENSFIKVNIEKLYNVDDKNISYVLKVYNCSDFSKVLWESGSLAQQDDTNVLSVSIDKEGTYFARVFCCIDGSCFAFGSGELLIVGNSSTQKQQEKGRQGEVPTPAVPTDAEELTPEAPRKRASTIQIGKKKYKLQDQEENWSIFAPSSVEAAMLCGYYSNPMIYEASINEANNNDGVLASADDDNLEIGQVLPLVYVLTFHDVVEKFILGRSYPKLTVSRAYLEAVIKQYKEQGYTFITPAEAFRMWQQNGELEAAKYIILRFDDGYDSFKDIVLPLLEEYDICAVVGINLANVNEANSTDKVRLLSDNDLAILARNPRVEIACHGKFHDGSDLNPEVMLEAMDGLEDRIEGQIQEAYNVVTFIPPFGYGSQAMLDRAYEQGLVVIGVHPEPVSDFNGMLGSFVIGRRHEEMDLARRDGRMLTWLVGQKLPLSVEVAPKKFTTIVAGSQLSPQQIEIQLVSGDVDLSTVKVKLHGIRKGVYGDEAVIPVIIDAKGNQITAIPPFHEVGGWWTFILTVVGQEGNVYKASWVWRIETENMRQAELAPLDNVLDPAKRMPGVTLDEAQAAYGALLEDFNSLDIVPWEKVSQHFAPAITWLKNKFPEAKVNEYLEFIKKGGIRAGPSYELCSSLTPTGLFLNRAILDSPLLLQLSLIHEFGVYLGNEDSDNLALEDEYIKTQCAADVTVQKDSNGYFWDIGGRKVPFINAVVYSPTEVEWPEYYTDNYYELYKALLSEAEELGGKAHAQALKDKGIDVIRIYNLSLTNEEDIRKCKELFRYVFAKYGIYVLLGDFCGLFYDPEEDENLKDQWIKDDVKILVEEYGAEPWVLAMLLGNENNYFHEQGLLRHVFWMKINKSIAQYYQFMNELAKVAKDTFKTIGVTKPVGLGSGDILLKEVNSFVEYVKNFDYLGYNGFRLPGRMGLYFKSLKHHGIDLAVVVTEFGVPVPEQCLWGIFEYGINPFQDPKIHLEKVVPQTTDDPVILLAAVQKNYIRGYYDEVIKYTTMLINRDFNKTVFNDETLPQGERTKEQIIAEALFFRGLSYYVTAREKEAHDDFLRLWREFKGVGIWNTPIGDLSLEERELLYWEIKEDIEANSYGRGAQNVIGAAAHEFTNEEWLNFPANCRWWYGPAEEIGHGGYLFHSRGFSSISEDGIEFFLPKEIDAQWYQQLLDIFSEEKGISYDYSVFGACTIDKDDNENRFIVTYTGEDTWGNVTLNFNTDYTITSDSKLIINAQGNTGGEQIRIYLLTEDDKGGVRDGLITILTLTDEMKAYNVDLSHFSSYKVKSIILEMGSDWTDNQGSQQVVVEDIFPIESEELPCVLEAPNRGGCFIGSNRKIKDDVVSQLSGFINRILCKETSVHPRGLRRFYLEADVDMSKLKELISILVTVAADEEKAFAKEKLSRMPGQKVSIYLGYLIAGNPYNKALHQDVLDILAQRQDDDYALSQLIWWVFHEGKGAVNWNEAVSALRKIKNRRKKDEMFEVIETLTDRNLKRLAMEILCDELIQPDYRLQGEDEWRLILLLDDKDPVICLRAIEILDGRCSQFSIGPLIEKWFYLTDSRLDKITEAMGGEIDREASDAMYKISDKVYEVLRGYVFKNYPDELVGHLIVKLEEGISPYIFDLLPLEDISDAIRVRVKQALVEEFKKGNVYQKYNILCILNKYIDKADNEIVELLIETALVTENIEILREEAIEGLTVFCTDDAIDAFIKLLNDSHPAVRAEAAMALGMCPAERASSYLIARFKVEKVLGVKPAIVWALGEIGGVESENVLINELEAEAAEGTVEYCALLMSTLGILRSQAAVRVLIALLRDDRFKGGPRNIIIKALGKIGNKKATKPLLGFLEEPLYDPFYKNEVIIALGQLRDPIAVKPLSEAFEEFDYYSKELIVKALGKINSKESREFLVDILLDPADEYFHDDVIIVLGESGESSVIDGLIIAMNNINRWDEGYQCASAIIKIIRHDKNNRKSNIAKLMQKLDDPNFADRAKGYIIDILGEIEAVEAVSHLIRFLGENKLVDDASGALIKIYADGKNQEVCGAAKNAFLTSSSEDIAVETGRVLVGIGRIEIVMQALDKALDQKDVAAAVRAIKVLSQSKVPEGIDKLVEVTQRGNREIKEAVLKAIFWSSEGKFIPVFIASLKYSDRWGKYSDRWGKRDILRRLTQLAGVKEEAALKIAESAAVIIEEVGSVDKEMIIQLFLEITKDEKAKQVLVTTLTQSYYKYIDAMDSIPCNSKEAAAYIEMIILSLAEVSLGEAEMVILEGLRSDREISVYTAMYGVKYVLSSEVEEALLSKLEDKNIHIVFHAIRELSRYNLGEEAMLPVEKLYERFKKDRESIKTAITNCNEWKFGKASFEAAMIGLLGRIPSDKALDMILEILDYGILISEEVGSDLFNVVAMAYLDSGAPNKVYYLSQLILPNLLPIIKVIGILALGKQRELDSHIVEYLVKLLDMPDETDPLDDSDEMVKSMVAAALILTKGNYAFRAWLKFVDKLVKEEDTSTWENHISSDNKYGLLWRDLVGVEIHYEIIKRLEEEMLTDKGYRNHIVKNPYLCSFIVSQTQYNNVVEILGNELLKKKDYEMISEIYTTSKPLFRALIGRGCVSEAKAMFINQQDVFDKHAVMLRILVEWEENRDVAAQAMERLIDNREIDVLGDIIHNTFSNVLLPEEILRLDARKREEFLNVLVDIENTPFVRFSPEERNNILMCIAYDFIHGGKYSLDEIEVLLEKARAEKDNSFGEFLTSSLMQIADYIPHIDGLRAENLVERIKALDKEISPRPKYLPVDEILEDDMIKIRMYFLNHKFFDQWKGQYLGQNFHIEYIDGREYFVFISEDTDVTGRLVTTRIEVPNPQEWYNVFEAVIDPTVDIIAYFGHSCAGFQLEESLKDAPLEMVGTKIIFMDSCHSFKYYYGQLHNLYKQAIIAGTTEMTKGTIGTVFLEALKKGILAGESIASIKSNFIDWAYKTKHRRHPSDKPEYYLITHEGEIDVNKYADDDGDSIPNIDDPRYDLVGRVNPVIYKDITFRYALAEPVRSLINVVNYMEARFSVNSFLKHFKIRLPTESNEGFTVKGWFRHIEDLLEAVRIIRQYDWNTNEEYFTIEINTGYQFCYDTGLKLLAMYEAYRYFADNYEIKTIDGKEEVVYKTVYDELTPEQNLWAFIKGFEVLALEFYAMGGEEKQQELEALFNQFKEKYNLPQELTFDLANKAYWAKEIAGTEWAEDTDSALMQIKKLFGVVENGGAPVSLLNEGVTSGAILLEDKETTGFCRKVLLKVQGDRKIQMPADAASNNADREKVLAAIRALEQGFIKVDCDDLPLDYIIDILWDMEGFKGMSRSEIASYIKSLNFVRAPPCWHEEGLRVAAYKREGDKEYTIVLPSDSLVNPATALEIAHDGWAVKNDKVGHPDNPIEIIYGEYKGKPIQICAVNSTVMVWWQGKLYQKDMSIEVENETRMLPSNYGLCALPTKVKGWRARIKVNGLEIEIDKLYLNPHLLGKLKNLQDEYTKLGTIEDLGKFEDAINEQIKIAEKQIKLIDAVMVALPEKMKEKVQEGLELMRFCFKQAKWDLFALREETMSRRFVILAMVAIIEGNLRFADSCYSGAINRLERALKEMERIEAAKDYAIFFGEDNFYMKRGWLYEQIGDMYSVCSEWSNKKKEALSKAKENYQNALGEYIRVKKAEDLRNRVQEKLDKLNVDKEKKPQQSPPAFDSNKSYFASIMKYMTFINWVLSFVGDAEPGMAGTRKSAFGERTKIYREIEANPGDVCSERIIRKDKEGNDTYDLATVMYSRQGRWVMVEHTALKPFVYRVNEG